VANPKRSSNNERNIMRRELMSAPFQAGPFMSIGAFGCTATSERHIDVYLTTVLDVDVAASPD
jgi:hypothetical protein